MESLDDIYEDEFISTFLTKYSLLERNARIWARNQEFDYPPILQVIIRKAKELNLISEEMFESYVHIRSMRNELIHSVSYKYRKYSEDEKNILLYHLDKLINNFQ